MRRILLLHFLLLNCFILNAQVCTKSQLPVNLQNGLVAFYPFCGNANDVSGNGNNGIIYGTVSLTSDRFGINSSAYSFPGNASSYIDCGSGSSLKIQKSLSICAWIYMEGGYYNPRILSINGPSNISAYNLAVAGTSNTSRILEGFFVNQDGSGTGFCCGNDGIVVPAKSWQFVVYTADSFGVSKLYLNGELKKSKSGLPVNNAGYITNLNIGRLPAPAYDAWGGYLDDIMLYNRALTACEVSQVYNATSTSFPVLEDVVFNSLNDTTSVCGTSTTLNAGSGFSSYNWNTGAITQTISPTTSGWYKVTVTNASGCAASDSTYLSLANAKILQKDTTICKGASIILSIDSSFAQSTLPCNASSLPSNLQSGLVAYYPFCGNANDATGKAHNGSVIGATLTTDRFGNSNGAYSFNGNGNYIRVADHPDLRTGKLSLSGWYYTESNNVNQCFFSKSNPVTTAGEQFYCTGNLFGIKRNPTVNCSPNTGWQYLWSNSQFQIGKWTHISFTWDGSTQRIYKDGVLVSSQNALAGNIDSCIGGDLKFGYWWSSDPKWLNGKLDDVMFHNRALSDSEIQQLYKETKSVTWSTGATTNSITVSPTQTTKYYVTVSDGITTCTDSVIVTVEDITGFNPLKDTTSVCGTTTNLDAGSGFSSYNWNTGATTQTISAIASGWYKVTVTNAAGCKATDSTYLSLGNAKILQKDTAICKGSSITLSLDNTVSGNTICSTAMLPMNLQNGLSAFYPFCGNANDIKGTNDGVVNGAILSADKFGSTNSAYAFNGGNNTINLSSPFLGGGQQTAFTIHARVKFNSIANGPSIWGKNLSWGEVNFLVRNDGSIQFVWANSVTGNKYSDITSLPGIISTGQWYDISVVFKNSTAVIYVNGTAIATLLKWVAQGGAILSTTTIEGSCNFTQDAGSSAFGSRIVSGSRTGYLNGIIDDFLVYNRALSGTEIQSLSSSAANTNITWSTGATTNSINVSPTQTTKYYVTVSDGITSCTDSVTVTVEDITGFNPLQDTTSVCGTTTNLDAGTGFTSYNWNTGATTQSITPIASGWHKVTVTNITGCTAMDSTYLSLVQAKILQKDTTICKSSSIILSLDNSVSGNTICSTAMLPNNLLNGLSSFYPFCGTANDIKGTNNGVVNGASLGTDKFNTVNSAYTFNGISNTINLSSPFLGGGQKSAFTIHTRVKFNSLTNSPNIWGKSLFWGEVNFEVRSDGTIRLIWANSITGNKYSVIYSSSGVIRTGQWYDITVVFNNGNGTIYLNGIPVTTLFYWVSQGGSVLSTTRVESTCNFTQDAGSSMFGARIESGNRTAYLNGTIDDFLVYNRALSGTEIQSLSSSIANSNITWSTGATTNSITVNPTQTTTYYVTVTDGITTCTDSVKVTVATADTSLAINGTTTFCNGQSVQLQAAANNTYQWFKDGVPVSGAVNQTFTATASGIYHARVTSALNCIDSTRKVTVTVTANPTSVISANSNTTFCTGGNVTLSATTGAGLTYQWQINGSNITSATSAAYNATTSGTYRVVITNSFNCSATSNTITVTVNALSATPTVTAAGSTTFCSGGSVTLNATAGATSYAWYNNGILINGATASSYIATQSGAYTVIITNANNCSSAASTAVNVTVNALPTTPTVTAAGATTFCAGGSVTLNATAGAASYAWYNNGTLINGATASSYTATQSGSYTVISTNANNCSSTASSAVNVTVNALPATPTVTAVGATTFCAGGSVTLNATAGAASYKWYNNGTLINGATASSYTATQSGAYTVISTNANNCSSAASAAITVVVNALPATPTVTTAGPTTFCVGGSVTLNATAGAASYTWYNNGTLINGATTQAYTATTNGSYSVMITNQNGCSSAVSVPIVVVINPLPTGNIIQPSATTICGSNPISLNVSGTAQSYQWFRNGVIINGATGNTFSALLAGTYTVELTSTTGCKAFAQGSVQLQQLLAPQPEITFNSRCVNTPVQFTVTGNVAQSGALAYAWSFGDGAVSNLTAPQHTYLQNGTYNVQLAVSSAACPSFNQTISKPITVQSPTPGLLYPPLNIVANTSTQIFARNFGVAYSWTPSAGLSNPFVANPFARVTAPATYQIRITDLAGCITIDTQTVRLFKENNIYVPKAFTPNGDGANDYLYPNLVGIRELRMFRIYNRWGILMYDAKSQMPGWDGMYMGVKQPMETYTWVAEGYDTNGAIVKRNGNVLLIR